MTSGSNNSSLLSDQNINQLVGDWTLDFLFNQYSWANRLIKTYSTNIMQIKKKKTKKIK